jgi:hypothetical protein
LQCVLLQYEQSDAEIAVTGSPLSAASPTCAGVLPNAPPEQSSAHGAAASGTLAWLRATLGAPMPSNRASAVVNATSWRWARRMGMCGSVWEA